MGCWFLLTYIKIFFSEGDSTTTAGLFCGPWWILSLRMPAGQWPQVFDRFVSILVFWLLCATNIAELFLFLTRRYCRACCGGPLPDFFLKLALLLVLSLALWFHIGIYIVFSERIQNLVIRPLALAGSMLLIYFMAHAFKRAQQVPQAARVLEASQQWSSEPAIPHPSKVIVKNAVWTVTPGRIVAIK